MSNKTKKNASILNLFIIISLFIFIQIYPINIYGQNEECTLAQSDAKYFALGLEREAKQLKECAFNEGALLLEHRAMELQRCAGYIDFSGDCSREFSKLEKESSETAVCHKEFSSTNKAFSVYKNAITDVSSYCKLR